MRPLFLIPLFITLAAGLLFGQSAESTPPSQSGIDVNAIDKNVDPCVDFYQYACGTWLKNNPIPKEESHWGRFSYDVCPSFSVDHPDNAKRLVNGNPYLPRFNAWAADCSTVNFCCTSGHCEDCRDSQAVLSWLIVNFDRFRDSGARLRTWIEISESYWKQFCWALYEAPTVSMRRRVMLPLVANE